MISATFFGEINELDSRAVWYSDEEDSSEDENEDFGGERLLPVKFKAKDHESVINGIQFDYCAMTQVDSLPEFRDCLISLSSQAKYKNFRLSPHQSTVKQIGQFESVAKAFLWSPQADRNCLWIMLDAHHRFVNSYMVNYFVEILIERLASLFKFSNDSQMIVLSQQFSTSDHLEYLTNLPATKQPFSGKQILPPYIIKNPFESAMFEFSTVAYKPATVVCLPNPKDFWFDNQAEWPGLPKTIIDQRLNDDSIDQSLIFT